MDRLREFGCREADRPEAGDPGTCDPLDRLASADDLNALWSMAQSSAFGANPGDALAMLSSRNARALDGGFGFHPLAAVARLIRRLWSALTGRPGWCDSRIGTGTGAGRGARPSFRHRIEPT
ncbi:hypothetical protein [Albidovulum sp.]|uniref:hypothetical protein n=1 Tax=Albidovulum sp. TaxID=1872424 RepID=UPI0039B95BB2